MNRLFQLLLACAGIVAGVPTAVDRNFQQVFPKPQAGVCKGVGGAAANSHTLALGILVVFYSFAVKPIPREHTRTLKTAVTAVLLLLQSTFCNSARVLVDHPAAGSDQMPLYYKSNQLGISKCTLPGTLQGNELAMHIWIRVAPPRVVRQPCDTLSPPGACGRIAKVKGFAFLQSIPAKGYILQLASSPVYHLFNNRIYLRSLATGQQYNLTFNKPSPRQYHHSYKDSPPGSHSNDVIDIFGNIVLHPDDVDALEFELRVDGFHWFCNVFVEPPTLLNTVTESAHGVIAQQEFNPTIQKAVAERKLIAPDKQLVATGRKLDSMSTWEHVDTASMTDRTQVWVQLASYHGVNMDEYAQVLWLHILWHQQFGVRKYFLHVSEMLGELMKKPRIQELINRGVLVVVAFVDLPRWETQPAEPSKAETYQHQVVQYNLASLALWGSDALILTVDLDEYLMTPQPMNIVQVFRQCSGTEVTSNLQIYRFSAACRPGLPTEVCSPQAAMMYPTWMKADIYKIERGEAAHPMATTMFQNVINFRITNQKALIDPNRVLAVHVHQGFRGTRANGQQVKASMDCVRIMHLDNLYKVRDPYNDKDVAVGSEDVLKWWWPASHAQQYSSTAAV